MRRLELSLFVCLWFVLQWSPNESLECFSCKDVHTVSDCHTSLPCAIDENCFTQATGVGNSTIFNLGCRHVQQCFSPTTQLSIGSIVGRDASVRTTTTGCDQCCSVDYCNKQMCTHASEVITNLDKQCHDDPDYNCALISGTFNVCGDIQHAKSVCRKWCGLCGLVDGGWSVWSQWSQCDVTCNQGTRSRDRTCTNPPPAHGGIQCIGNSVENSNCSLEKCPVHGSWSLWSPWGSCSKTCGVGLQRRDRSCSNPFPGPNGDPCFGDSRDDRVCFSMACANGMWSAWGPWGQCSASCNGGMKTRSRACDNPPPSTFGKGCDGNNENTAVCNIHTCPAAVVFFAAHGFTQNAVNGAATLYNVDANHGGGYNSATGKFTCSIPGLYYFSVTFNTYKVNGFDVYCHIRHNGHNIVSIWTSTADNVYQSASASTYVYLANGDTVDVGACSHLEKVETDPTGMFNGALITPA